MTEPGSTSDRAGGNITYHGAIGCWLGAWLVSVMVGYGIGSTLASSQGHDGYAALVGLVGVLVISPIGLACSTVFLVAKRYVVTFILCGVPTLCRTVATPR
jgi:hypothetical protein